MAAIARVAVALGIDGLGEWLIGALVGSAALALIVVLIVAQTIAGVAGGGRPMVGASSPPARGCPSWGERRPGGGGPDSGVERRPVAAIRRSWCTHRRARSDLAGRRLPVRRLLGGQAWITAAWCSC
jgi:hypothetical protein